ncbi:hypothetical protein [Pseudanabaena sp. FACHB-2040]|uniref:hypothetical protein n=1 Tax=Pseudanabaena sp. FACHB-2040 TaxID=2692859 RepID=UPI00168325D4|nr:hypothetical protein [Pseudanabaena sp. FACHB-2040]MBD0266992.1 hypothetical protein [Cyanobacteria bacterium Co-bin8]MBD2256328.1 hypothetical protein [Pseudanabaena sp. FACHB-2040]
MQFASIGRRLSVRALACAALVSGTVLLFPLAGVAQDGYYVRQVQSRLMNLASRMGYEPVADPYVSLLGRDTYDSTTYYLEAGISYLVMATCDEDCLDLDLELYDAEGNLLTYDDAVDPTPMVTFTPEVSGPYTVDIIMYSCSVDSCYQAVDVFVEP